MRDFSANGESLDWTSPRVKMRLVTDITEWSTDLLSVFGVSFEGIEDLN